MVRRRHVQAWYYEADGEKQGPFAEDDFVSLISNSSVKAGTAIWRQGMDEWLAAGTTELSRHFDETGTPTPETKQAVAAAQEKVAENKAAAHKPQGETRSVTGFQKWLQISLALYALGALAGMASSVRTLYFYDQIEKGVFAGNEEAMNRVANSIDSVALIIVSLTLPCFLSSAIAYGRFFHRCVANLKAMHSRHMTAGPHESWAWYIVPIANLWKPLSVFSEVRDGSYAAAGDGQNSSSLVMLWWAAWLAGSIMANASNILINNASDINALTYSVITSLIAGLCLCTAALSLRRLVGQIGRAHESARLGGNASVFE